MSDPSRVLRAIAIVEVKQRYEPVFWRSFRLRGAASAPVVLLRESLPQSLIAWRPPGGPCYISRFSAHLCAQSQAPYPEVATYRYGAQQCTVAFIA